MNHHPPQKIIKIRRDYNTWVANEMLEDYALRYAPKSFRKWSAFRVANTALGAVSFLVLEAIGGALTLNYGFTNAGLAILVVGLVIFLTGWPISHYAARYNVDMDLLTRGAGFGYIGSTITSLIYASFTFIFFALEAAVMSLALELCLGIPLVWAYVLSALVVIPLVTHGITWINRIQAWTQPVWVILMVVPYVYLLSRNPELLAQWIRFGGDSPSGAGFDLLAFGAASSVAFALVTQIGEQVDFLRFLPERGRHNRLRWHAAMLAAGPGWIVPGMVKQFAGGFLAFVAVRQGLGWERAADPARMYLVGYGQVFHDLRLAMAAVVVFVVVSQIKINMTNAYAGSLAWSNFFSRMTHSHPGRVVWVVFNVSIALLLMELGVFGALEKVLGVYANVAIAWVGAVVADLVVNKPLGLSPPFIEFKRAHLHDVNPVGVGAMLAASVLSIAAYLGLFGAVAKAFAPFIALLAAFTLAPAIAWYTKGRYYLARAAVPRELVAEHRCSVCGNQFEPEDKTFCPFYQGVICSLCCTLDARCGDACKPGGRVVDQLAAAADAVLPGTLSPRLRRRLLKYFLVFTALAGIAAGFFAILYFEAAGEAGTLAEPLRVSLFKAYAVLLLLLGVGAWWLVLTEESRQVAQEESNKQTSLLMQEIEEHRKTDAKLQQAMASADAANRAKSRFLSDMSHELRSPLNSILGYAELLAQDPQLPASRRDSVDVIRQSGEHLLALIDDILDIARIEAGKLRLERESFDLTVLIQQLVEMFQVETERRSLAFRCQMLDPLPRWVRGDEKRIRQILINLLCNAVKFTEHGEVLLRVGYGGEVARFGIVDTGVGIAADEIDRIFQPFQRGNHGGSGPIQGSGLGLTISRLLAELMGGELTVSSRLGAGSEFRLRLFLPEQGRPVERVQQQPVGGYRGRRRSLLAVDDQAEQRRLLVNLLTPLGFDLSEAANGAECLQKVQAAPPDLILLDLVMPGMDGLELTRRLRSECTYRGPILMVSANAFAGDRRAAMEAGCDDYIVKPIRLPKLVEAIGFHLCLHWIEAGEVPAPAGLPTCLALAAELMAELLQEAHIGHARGVRRVLDRIAAEGGVPEDFLVEMRALVREFRLPEIARRIEQELARDRA